MFFFLLLLLVVVTQVEGFTEPLGFMPRVHRVKELREKMYKGIGRNRGKLLEHFQQAAQNPSVQKDGTCWE